MDGVATIIHQLPRLWGVVTAAVALSCLLGVSLRLIHAGRSNKDPLQHELARLIVEMMVRGMDNDARDNFLIGSRTQFNKALVVDRSKQRKHLARALLAARPTLGEAGYERARAIIRTIT